MTQLIFGQKRVVAGHNKSATRKVGKKNDRSAAVGRCARSASDREGIKACFGMSNAQLDEKGYWPEGKPLPKRKE